MPVSRGVKRSDSTSAFRLGCEVRPDIDGHGAVGDVEPDLGRPCRTLAAWAPPMSCVWKWIGTPTSSRRALTSVSAA